MSDITGDHFAHPATSYSKLKVLKDDPFEYWAAFENVPSLMPFDDSEARDRGHVAHAACLEPHRLNEIYIEFPKHLLSGKNDAVSSDAAKEFEDAARTSGIIPMKPREMDKVRRMVTSLLTSEYGDWFTMPSLKEQAICWTEIVDGVEVYCKAKLDMLRLLPHAERNIIIDLKFIRDASDAGFAAAAHQWKYALQDAQYRRAAEVKFGKPAELYFLAVQDHPAGTRIGLHHFEDSSDEQQYGEALRTHLLKDLVRRRAENDWRASWEKNINPVRLTKWQMQLSA